MKNRILFFLFQNSFGGRGFKELCRKLFLQKEDFQFKDYEVFSFGT